MRADFVNEAAKILNIKRKDMIEKDLLFRLFPIETAWTFKLQIEIY